MSRVRIVVATDGSDGALVACAAVGSVAWPAGSVVRLVAVRNGHTVAVGASRSALRRDDVAVDLRHGDPAEQIVAAATDHGADLVVVGCRGWGPWATVPVGSVSTAVVDRAPCPVLVARGPRLEPVVFATDGSECAFRAELLLRRWPRTSTDPVRVVSVRHRPALPGLPGLPAALSAGQAADAGSGHASAQVDSAEGLAEAAATRLAAFGVPADPVVYSGDPADGIVLAAREIGAGLIVVGTRGRTGLTRLVLGSVARRVLTHARCSVLVVRQVPAPVRIAEPVAAAGAGAG